MTYLIDIQNALINPISIDEKDIKSWASLAMSSQYSSAEVTLRLVEADEMTLLNHTYRKQNKPTNVLSFPAVIPAHIKLDYPFLGDIIICPQVLQTESVAQNININDHWAHIVIHGVLHLMGYDHIYEDDTILMQSLEIKLLHKLKINNPYQEDN
jgi:probable rRNA maturation factor